MFSAIAWDYDLNDEDGLRQARATLDSLKATADEDEGIAELGRFDPSGTSGITGLEGGRDAGDEGSSCAGVEVKSTGKGAEREAEARGENGMMLQQLKQDKLKVKGGLNIASSSDSQDGDGVTVLSEGVSSLGLTDRTDASGDDDSISGGLYKHGNNVYPYNKYRAGEEGSRNRESDCNSNENDDIEVPDQMSSHEKEMLLRDMFPSVDGDTVSETLESANEDYSAALDQLLNLVYFAEAAGSSGEDGSMSSYGSSSNASSAAAGAKKKSKAEMRSIDAFALDEEEGNYNHAHRSGRRNRQRWKDRGPTRRADGAITAANGGAQPASSSKNKWEVARDDVQFISSRVKKPESAIASMYHEHGASVFATVLALMEEMETEQKKNANAKDEVEKEELDLMLEAQAIALAEVFPELIATQLISLVRLTYPSQSAAYDLAEVLQRPMDPVFTYSSVTSASAIPTTANPTPARVRSASRELRSGHWQTGSSSTASTTSTRSSSTLPFTSSYNNSNNTPAHHFTAAARYARRANRTNQLGGAAAYHAQRGHEALSAQRAARSSAADALIRSRTNHQTHNHNNSNKSSSGDIVLDLHGLTVADAQRIVRREVLGWWNSLGEDRAGVVGLDGGWAGRFQGAKRRPELVLVTGRGQHSVGGRAKVGPAVIDMLVREGWKVEIGSGVVYVTGRKRKR